MIPSLLATFQLFITYHFLYWTTASSAVGQNEAICVKKTHPSPPKISLYASTFKQLIEDSDVFVDKTLFIKAFLESPHDIIVITCPSKWSKSVNLDMLKMFLEVQVDADGNKIKSGRTSLNYELFKKGQIIPTNDTAGKLKSPMLIAKEKEAFKHHGKHPVICFNYQKIFGDMFSKVLNSTIDAFSFTFKQHRYMEQILNRMVVEKNGTKGEPAAREDLDKFRRFLYGEEYNETEITSGLRFLTRILHQHFEKPVYILIDDYEAPFMKIFHDKEFMKIYRTTVLEFFGDIFKKTFNDNKHLAKALITGRLHVFGDYLFSGIQSVSQYNMMHNPFAQFYGFSRTETEMLYDYADIDYKLVKEAYKWYEGYRIGESCSTLISNPSSIATFFNERKIRAYWGTSDTFFVLDTLAVPKMRQVYEWVLQGNNVAFTMDNIHLTLPDIAHMKEVVVDKEIDLVQSNTTELIMSRLHSDGFFTYNGKKYIESRGANVTLLKLPNIEVKDEVSNRLLWAYQMQDSISCWTMNRVCNHLEEFICSTGSNFINLYKALENLFANVDIYSRKATRKNKHKIATTNVRLARSIFNYIGIQMSQQYQYEVNITMLPHLPVEMNIPDLVMIRNQTAVLIKTKYNFPSGRGVYQLIKHYIQNYNGSRELKAARVIAIGVSADCKPDIYTHTHAF